MTRTRIAAGAARGAGASDRRVDLRRPREGAPEDERPKFPGLGWLRQPSVYSDREWILEIATAVPRR